MDGSRRGTPSHLSLSRQTPFRRLTIYNDTDGILAQNGIIHNCSHPPSSENDPHFRITEEQMILAIFAYIDHLFTKIKPQKVFFMAIDGVAPRAKMNQQRSRRFRTAKDAVEKRQEAEKKGEKLPEEKAFDSNCITPGTPFMARLSNHLKYYVTKRISEDAEWRNVKVILSGHDVPGEGEHKIQEFIRLTKAQPDYNPNTRHCLYGLDADLIMLGLLSHDPHFCLLREEVTFGRKSKKTTGLANTNFYLLHLSLLREYLDLEFGSLATQISFKYDLERIIDDFILMAVFVGNDFLPHLPDLHINEGALERIWGIYKEILPVAGGYLNEHGTISLPRLQLMLDKLAQFEIDNFEEEYADQNWYKGKQQKEIEAMEKARKRGKMVITKDQQKILNQIKQFVTKHQARPSSADRCVLVNNFSARDQRFVQELGDQLHLLTKWDEVDDYGQNIVVMTFDLEGVSEDGASAVAEEEADGEWESEEEEESEGDLAIQRIFAKYNKAKVVDNVVEDFEEAYEDKLKENLDDWKKRYYKEKLELDFNKPEDMHSIVFRYIEGLQWILNYYYKGVSSWGWFYNFHYAPRITDLKGIAEYKFDFDFGKPFTPFQQLMGVLPEESKEHVPPAYRDLMFEETSPIIDFYPKDFALDMNGKKQDWEAVIKIPFIDEKRLLKAMAAREVRLTSEEKDRNKSGVVATQFVFDDHQDTTYPSSAPGYFPDLVKSQCRSSPFNLPTLGDGINLILGLLDGVHLGASALAGFPSLQTLAHQGTLGYHGVNVFQSDSKNQSMIITVTSKHDRPNTGDIAKRMIGQRTFHSWPYLHEGMVVAVSDDMFKYELQQMGKIAKVVSTPHNPYQAIAFKKQADHIEHHNSKRFGIITGSVDVVLHVRPLKGLKRLDTGALVKDYEAPEKEIAQAYQLAVTQVTFEDERYLEKDAPPMSQEFPNGEKVIFLGHMAYGTAAQVIGTTEKTLDVGLAFFPSEKQENQNFSRLVAHRPTGIYYPSPVLARRIGVSPLALSRVTSTLLVLLEDGSRTNIGLALKFESKGLKVLGYSRRNDKGWEFSEKTAQVLKEYKEAFPEPFGNLDSRGGDLVTSAELCPTAEDPDKVVKGMKKWLKEKDLVDLDTVSLFAEQLEKESVQMIEKLADQYRNHKSPDQIKRAVVKAIPRQAVLKPCHAIYRLQGQKFAVGDRVIMVQDAAAGGVPLAMKGVVVGLGTRDIDVVWDVPFMGGETLQGRCSEYRGSTVPFSSCLNLTQPQFGVGFESGAKPLGQNAPFKPQLGPRPVLQMQNYQPSIPHKNKYQQHDQHQQPTIMRNPNRALPNQVNGNTSYGNATKGVKPPVQQQQAQGQGLSSHGERLANALGAKHVAHRPGHALPSQVVRSPNKQTNVALPLPLPVSQGQPPAQHQGGEQNGDGRGRGRGGFRGRGGRGRGGRGGARGGAQVNA
ncbi:5'-3' exoribonuclease 1 [Kwoniella shivajii]|uniref:5'-3' exoribonuclease 1 n=1 Tax=Kwoniella shivajii TaxID=564305 RepID=A0ABZ1D513_9TREE|nr:5'-3' exoribonuclease 1 [Kwoniella shivajii]